MGRKNDAIVPLFKDKEHFADIFNGTVYDGKQVVKPWELELMDGESNLFFKDKNKKNVSIHRFRDVIMKWKNELYLCILACEVQDEVHYAMPVRNMMYDSISYVEQIDEHWDSLSKEEKSVGSGEFLSHFRKEDRLYPVITLVFYAGDDWDGAKDLYSMLGLEDMADSDVLKKYIPNYHINLVNPNYMEDLNIFKSDLQIIFGMLQCKKDKIALRGYIDKNRDYFMSVNHKTAYAISAMLNSDRLFRELEDKEGDENMCQAIEDIYSEGVETGYNNGISQGINQGISQGREEAICTTVSLLKDMCSAEEIVNKLVVYFKIDEEKARSYI